MSYAQWPLAPQTPLCFFFCCATEHAKLYNSYVNWSWNQPYQPYQPTPCSTCPLGRYLGPLEVELSWSDPLGQSLKSSCKELGHFETGPSLARSTHLPSCFQPRQDLRYHWALLASWFFYCNSFKDTSNSDRSVPFEAGTSISSEEKASSEPTEKQLSTSIAEHCNMGGTSTSAGCLKRSWNQKRLQNPQ